MIDINNNRVSEIIVGKIPKWISAFVIIIIFLFVSFVIILSYMVPYQEIISSDIKIKKIDHQKALGKMELLPNGYGMIEVGQNVIISLDAFPENIYGVAYGKVSKVSTGMNSSGKYLIEVNLVDMNSSNGINLNIFDSQTGKAKIIVASRPYIYQLCPMLNKINKNKHTGHM